MSRMNSWEIEPSPTKTINWKNKDLAIEIFINSEINAYSLASKVEKVI